MRTGKKPIKKFYYCWIFILGMILFYRLCYAQHSILKADEIYLDALVAYSEKNYPETVKKLTTLLVKYPNYNYKTDQMYYWLGMSYDKLQDFNKALKYYYASIKRYPNSNKTKLCEKEIKKIEKMLGSNIEDYSNPEFNELLKNRDLRIVTQDKKLIFDKTTLNKKTKTNPQIPKDSLKEQPSVSNVFYETDIRQALQDVAAQTGVTIITDVTVQGYVTMEINDLPLETALKRILMVGGFTYNKIGDFYFVGTADPSNPAFGILSTTENIKVNYIPATVATEQLSDFYKAYLKPNDQTNTITVSASREIIERIKKDLKIIDVPAEQVEIEAIVMEVKEGALKSFGIDWQVLGSQDNRNYTGVIDLSSGLVDTMGPMVSFGRSEIGHLHKGKLSLDIFTKLHALVTEGKAEIRANPKVVTANAQPATIYIAKEQYFSVVTGPVNYPYTKLEKVSVGIMLTIKPFISEESEITVKIETEVSDAVGQGREGLPLVDSRKVNTQIRVKDGEYITIGGLTQIDTHKTQNKIPLLGSIPILGYLFSHTKYERIKNDVVILIRPRILR